MASPKFDVLHLRFARMIDDPVTAATTDGDTFTSAKRSGWLVDGMRAWVDKVLISGDHAPIRGYINVESKALTSSVLTLSSSSGWTGGVYRILSAVNTTQTTDVVVKPMPQSLYDYALLGTNKYLIPSTTNQFYIEENGNFKLYGGAATDTIQLRYIKLIPEYTANYASDIAVDENWYDDILLEAFARWAKEYPSQTNTARLMANQ